MGRIAVDTTFLIDWHRQAVSGRETVGDFLRQHAGEHFFVSLPVLGEFAAGFPTPDDPLYRKIRTSLGLLAFDEPVVEVYRRIFQDLKKRGALIGANDLWIAAVSIRHEIPLVTRNTAEFLRVPGIEVLGY